MLKQLIQWLQGALSLCTRVLDFDLYPTMFRVYTTPSARRCHPDYYEEAFLSGPPLAGTVSDLSATGQALAADFPVSFVCPCP